MTGVRQFKKKTMRFCTDCGEDFLARSATVCMDCQQKERIKRREQRKKAEQDSIK